MPVFLFYPHLPDGVASVFVAKEFPNAVVALTHAQTVLAEHGSATEVVVWSGNTVVGRARIGGSPELVATTRDQEYSGPHAPGPPATVK